MDRRTMMIGAGALILATGAGVFSFGGRDDLPELGAANAQEAANVDTSSIVEMSIGADDAPVTVIEYASFTCPHCATFHNGPAQQLKSEYVDTGKVRFVYRDVYFDRPGLWASMVARCDSNRFFGITDILYKQQRDWIGDGQPAQIAENLRRIGKVAGLSDEQLDSCLADADKAQTLVAWFQQNAEADDINSTPSLIINGEKHGNMSWADLKALIDENLAN
ncbi:DsbA family protein [Lutimaribacter sp. EGI FJ00015]|uniref:DsbA family protein n=1 Tax=Lutimaribacter degradans TaxID=2945989 RepID=A0ACC5ZYG4_9RHOB|nr:DsbA family protein [Lutimaribacter sp. EGI FJ00013]MCM2563389.1 DsbA family protein [Lutimaribacter sp. EGI FJ00013]MCO0614532.1 DsbA family protein [Lutimaribacter sp. EGI FJ00015]MCO0637205.1 DsbA family protein [Lutimaribacter sp. EGI FJ00014]